MLVRLRVGSLANLRKEGSVGEDVGVREGDGIGASVPTGGAVADVSLTVGVELGEAVGVAVWGALVGDGVSGSRALILASVDKQKVKRLSSTRSETLGSKVTPAWSPTQHWSSCDIRAQKQAPKLKFDTSESGKSE